jgi:hypothetical protein
MYYEYYPQFPWNPEDRIIGKVLAMCRRLETLKIKRRKLKDL